MKDFESQVKSYDNHQLSEEELLEKSSLEKIRRTLEQGEDQPVPRPVERIDGAFSN